MIDWSLIDWRMVGFSALWILGLAIVLAAFSMADYRAGVERRKLRSVLGEPGSQGALNLGMTLFSAGLVYSGRAWWERAVWGLLALAFAAQAAVSFRRNLAG
ncbi:MAG: hypothetical protein HY784_17970 [Chloroflexi bacterium]|nr:hypothetical protein [Chloroflexota bacterium]